MAIPMSKRVLRFIPYANSMWSHPSIGATLAVNLLVRFGASSFFAALD